MNDQLFNDLTAITEHLEGELDNFVEHVRNNGTPGLAVDECDALYNAHWANDVAADALIDKASRDVRETHIYACQYRVYHALLDPKDAKPEIETKEGVAFVLHDHNTGDPIGSPGRVTVEDGGSLAIFLEGYGDRTSANGHGNPIVLERYEGKIQLIVHADINQEDPTHIIKLGEAMECCRHRATCENCGYVCDEDDLGTIQDISGRFGQDGRTAAGRCPKCDHLSFLPHKESVTHE